MPHFFHAFSPTTVYFTSIYLFELENIHTVHLTARLISYAIRCYPASYPRIICHYYLHFPFPCNNTCTQDKIFLNRAKKVLKIQFLQILYLKDLISHIQDKFITFLPYSLGLRIITPQRIPLPL